MSTTVSLYQFISRELVTFDRLTTFVDLGHKRLNEKKATLDHLQDQAHSWRRFFKKEISEAIVLARTDVDAAREEVAEAEQDLAEYSQYLDTLTESIMRDGGDIYYRIGQEAKQFFDTDELQVIAERAETFRPWIKVLYKAVALLQQGDPFEAYAEHAKKCLEKAINDALAINDAIEAYNLYCLGHIDAVRDTLFNKLFLPKLDAVDFSKCLEGLEHVNLRDARELLDILDGRVAKFIDLDIPAHRRNIEELARQHDCIIRGLVRHTWTEEWIAWRDLPSNERYRAQAG